MALDCTSVCVARTRMRLDEYARTICSAYIQGIAHLNDHNKGRANQYVAVLPTRRPRRFGANGEVMPYGPGAVCSAKQQVRCGPPALAVHIVMSSLLHSTGLAPSILCTWYPAHGAHTCLAHACAGDRHSRGHHCAAVVAAAALRSASGRLEMCVGRAGSQRR